MFKYVVFNKENEVVGTMPVENPIMEAEGTYNLSHVMLYCGDHPVCELPVSHLPNEIRATETISVDFGSDLPIGYEVWNLCMRMRQTRVANLFHLIRQAGDVIGGQKARKPIHNFYPQTPSPSKQAVQNEKSQPLRGWRSGRMVQRIIERLVG